MTIEEISVKFTADTNNLKRALSEITESLKGTEAQTLDIASAMDEITQPIKDMSKDIRSLVNQSDAYNKRMSDLTKTVGSANRVISQTAEDTQKTSKKSMAETTKMVQGWQKVKDKMLEVGKTRPTFNRNTNTAQESGVSSRSAGDSSQNPTQKALDSEQAKLQRLLNTLNEQQIKLDVINQKYDLSSQKLQKTESEIKSQQASLDGLKKDYEAMSSIMSELNINDSINEEMKRLRTTLEENKISFNELDDAKKRLEQSPYEIVDVGKSYMSMDAIIKKMDELDASSEDAWSKLEKLETAMEGVSAKSQVFGSVQGMQRMNSVITQQENKLRSLQNAYNTASSQSASLSGKQEILQAKMQQSKDVIHQAQERVVQLGEALRNTSNADKKNNFFGSLGAEIKNLGNAMSSLIHKFQNGVSYAKKFGSNISGIGKNLASAYSNTSLLGRGLSSLKDKLSGLGSKFSQTARMVKSMVLSMLFMQLMSGMGETLQSFAKQSSTVNNDLSALAASFTYLKSSILSAFQPLLSYITPILTSIVNTVADAFNKLAEFFAYLTGQTTFEKAVYTQKDYSASLDKSTKSAQALKNVLLGFDEITKLEDDSSGSGSGDGSGSLNTGNWETTKVDISSSLADSIKSGNWEAVGKALGDKINSALGSINWNSVQTKCNGIASNIASFLNGAIEETDWSLVGSTLGNGINTIMGAINTFQKKFDFQKFGKSIATSLNSAISTTDWSLVGNTLGTSIQNVISTGIGFVNTFDFKKAGQSASTTVNSFFGAINFKQGGKTFGEGIKGVLESVTTFFDEVDWDSIGTDLVDAITSVDWIGIITDAIKAVISVAGAFYKLVLAIWTAIINEIKNTDWSAQAQKAWEGIKDVWSKLKDTALEVGLKFKQTAGDLWDLITTAWNAIKDKAVTVEAKLEAKLGPSVDRIKGWAQDKLSDWKDKTANLKADVATKVSEIREWWNNRTAVWKDKLADFRVNGAATTVAYVREWWNNRTSQWKNKIASFKINGAATAVSSVRQWWNNRSAKWTGKVVSFKIRAATSVQELKNSFRSAINTVIGWINRYIIDSVNKISIKIPQVKILGEVVYGGTTLGFNLNHIATFATGGFPEDGLFMANHGELVGKFSNGKTAVANNTQIVEGIEAGVYRAVTAANSGSGRSGGSSPVINVYVGGKQVTDVVIKDINDRTIQTGKNPILV